MTAEQLFDKVQGLVLEATEAGVPNDEILDALAQVTELLVDEEDEGDASDDDAE